MDLNLPEQSEPWRPFRTRLDFELAELLEETNMNHRQKAALIKLFKRGIAEPGEFTIIDEVDLAKTWSGARDAHMSRMSKTTMKFKNPATQEEDIEYEMFSRTLEDWMFDILNDRKLQQACQFDAMDIAQWSEDSFDRIYNEPWTGKAWWDVQSKLPNDAGIFFIILHADKTKLSSFGTAKGYPIYARCGNLPLWLRNGRGNGCERLVGWLPIVADEHSEDFTEKGYVNFKRIVWTEGFRKVLQSVAGYAATGINWELFDGTTRWLHPIVMILSADYEEQGMMSMTRGVNSKVPCPVCLVPDDELHNLGESYPLRTTVDMRNVLESTKNMTATDKEAKLKSFGLRDIHNIFWDFSYWEVYAALTWDRLHAFHIGLFRDHLLKEFLRVMKAVFKAETNRINIQLEASPRWPGLIAFSTLHNLAEFSDARKFEDLSKALIFASYNVFAPSGRGCSTTEPYLLLLLIRSYLELDMFTSLRNPSERLIQQHEEAIQVFGKRLSAYMAVTTNTDKSWDAPKVHTHLHVPDDVRNKGATVNGNTKTFEEAHIPFHENFQMKTNFKNVGTQLTRMNDEAVAGSVMRDNLDRLDAREAVRRANEASLEEDEKVDISAGEFENVSLGSKQATSTISALVTAAPAEFAPAFRNLHAKIAHRLSLMKFDGDRLIKLKPDIHEITAYRLIRSHFPNLNDWTLSTDFIRASPLFHNRERYDCLAWQATASTFAFGQLLSAFSIEFAGKTAFLALVIPYDHRGQDRASRSRDSEFNFIRVRRRPWKDSMVISLDSIIRGACIPQAWDCDAMDEYIVNDCIDTDWWLRLRRAGGEKGLAWRS
ncbi:hypothetical protein BKA70DRAFT_1378000 [Coprinopsis sp. MPI-PUGE-AT-0042]|nr:hypothetical protein BKA70DRAFT_1378000 [Coprinopsis sp. MPI-PUGE-AT-0042]